MTVILPGAIPSAQGWALLDYLTVRARSAPAAGGQARVQLDQLAGDEMWLIDHAVIACSTTSAPSVRWYESAETPTQLLDGSASGTFDVAEWPNGLRVSPGQSLVVVWDGCADGDVGSVAIQYRYLRRTG